MSISRTERKHLHDAIGDQTSAAKLIQMTDIMSDGVFNASFSIGAENTNAIVTTITLTGPDGVALAAPTVVDVILFSSAAATATTGNTYTIASGGTGIVETVVANKILKCVTNSSGVVSISLTNAGAVTCHIGVVLAGGKLAISGAVAHT